MIVRMHDLVGKKILVTGAAGFIGFHLSRNLLSQGAQVFGLDNLNPYYSVALKESRLKILTDSPHFSFTKANVEDASSMRDYFKTQGPFDFVIHLAAQAGVRHSLSAPWDYIRSNIDGTLSVLEAVRHHNPTAECFFASSSSVYGASTKIPFSEADSADQPLALYGATKRADELMAHAYSHLFSLRTSLLRFFTVYGPWGRPDMALFKFTRAILAGEPVEVYNEGDMQRDFTYVEDVVRCIVGLMAARKTKGDAYEVFNVGGCTPVPLMEFVKAIEHSTGRLAKIERLPMQQGDVRYTAADTDKLKSFIGFVPATPIFEGVDNFVRWFKEYHQI